MITITIMTTVMATMITATTTIMAMVATSIAIKPD